MKELGTPETFRLAKVIGEGMVTRGEFNPI